MTVCESQGVSGLQQGTKAAHPRGYVQEERKKKCQFLLICVSSGRNSHSSHLAGRGACGWWMVADTLRSPFWPPSRAPSLCLSRIWYNNWLRSALRTRSRRLHQNRPILSVFGLPQMVNFVRYDGVFNMNFDPFSSLRPFVAHSFSYCSRFGLLLLPIYSAQLTSLF